MTSKEITVDDFMNELDHPYKQEIEELRKIIKSANKDLIEHIKWNGPSYVFNGEDRITFRLNPPTNIQLIFHRGAKVKDASNFKFDDESGLIEWITKDRGTVTFKDMEEIKERESDFVKLVNAWLKVN